MWPFSKDHNPERLGDSFDKVDFNASVFELFGVLQTTMSKLDQKEIDFTMPSGKRVHILDRSPNDQVFKCKIDVHDTITDVEPTASYGLTGWSAVNQAVLLPDHPLEYAELKSGATAVRAFIEDFELHHSTA